MFGPVGSRLRHFRIYRARLFRQLNQGVDLRGDSSRDGPGQADTPGRGDRNCTVLLWLFRSPEYVLCERQQRGAGEVVDIAVTSGTTLAGWTVAIQARNAGFAAFGVYTVAGTAVGRAIGKDQGAVEIRGIGVHPIGRMRGQGLGRSGIGIIIAGHHERQANQ